MNKKGILNKKLRNYYEDANLLSYRSIFLEAIISYKGKQFNKILDVGSGIGVFLDSVNSFGYNLFALEASKYGLKRLKEKGYNVQKFFLEKDKKLPFNDNEFSFILFNQTIEHLKKNVGQYYIKEIIRILEPGGVAIIKSPSYFCKIWRTDPHHVYCWKPNELLNEINKYKNIKDVIIQRVTLKPWMMFNYDEKIINTWHKYNKYPFINKIFNLFGKILDKIIYKFTKSDIMLAVSNISFVKK